MPFGFIRIPFIGGISAERRSRSMGLGVERDSGGTTVWLGRWELNADTLLALPILGPVAVAVAVARA
ncbi:hypothetical protein [Bosea thiooxidans]